MRIAEVIGTVTLSRCHPSLVGARWVIGVPFSLDGLRKGHPDREDVVIYDGVSAGFGSKIGVSEGAEAAMPFHPERKPIDAYAACLLDKLTISE